MAAQQVRTASAPGSGVLLSGGVPPLADAYFTRAQSGLDLASSLRPGETVVLVHGAETDVAPAAQGGTGKTQLAVEFAHVMWNTRAVEILVWVSAASRESVITGFAQAANTVDASQPYEGAEIAAARFVAWLDRTRRPWALIIDDLAELSDLEELWPTGASGRVLITTRLPATAFEGPVFDGPAFEGKDLRVIPVPGLNRREALDYIASRLTDYPDQRIEALDLGEDLDGLPLGLAQATAVMSARRQGCREYRALLAERLPHMPAVDGVSAAVMATWSIAAECAHELPPAGLAWPTLVLAAMMDHHGVPGVVLTGPAACGYITGRPSTATGPIRTWCAPPSTTWPRPAWSPSTRPARRAPCRCTPACRPPCAPTCRPPTSSRSCSPPPTPCSRPGRTASGVQGEQGRPGSSRPGSSRRSWSRRCGTAPGRCGPPTAGCCGSRRPIRCCSAPGCRWSRQAVPRGHHVLEVHGGHQHPAARPGPRQRRGGQGQARRGLRVGREVRRRHRRVPDRARGPGAGPGARGRRDHRGPQPPGPRLPVAGRPADAIALYERTVADSGRLLGPAHPVTLDARASLAGTYQAAGRPREAIAAYELLLADAERQLGAGHPTTLSARASLGAAYAANGQAKEAIAQFERALADQERMHGRDHPDTIAARASLASAFRAAGKQKDAIAQYERVLADRERVQGADHPDAIAARANLAYAYRSAGRLREAIPLYERTLADRMRVQGPDHRDTLTARSNLAACYQQARRMADAIPQYERALADSERMLGPVTMETLTTRCNLATAYYTAGRLADVVAVLQRALTDCERYLGPDHQMTQTVRENLDAATQA